MNATTIGRAPLRQHLSANLVFMGSGLMAAQGPGMTAWFSRELEAVTRPVEQNPPGLYPIREFNRLERKRHGPSEPL